MPSAPTRSDPVTFRTKVDLWLILVLVVALGGSLLGTVVALEAGEPGTWVPLGIIAGTLLLIGCTSIPTEYALSDVDLTIRFGVMRRVVVLSAIERVYRSRNPLSSPAWSLDRVAIHYREGSNRRFVLISPGRRDEFMKLLAERARLQESHKGLVPSTDPH